MVGFKVQIFKYALIAMIVFELASLPFLGLDVKFSYGLVLGTCIGIVNFNILAWTSKKVLDVGNKWLAPLGYIVRLLIYGYAFYTCMKVNVVAGLASVLGFMTIKLALIYIYGIKAKFSKNRKVRPEVQAEFEEMDRMKEAKEENRDA